MSNPSNELLYPLLDHFIAEANELRYRVMDMPNPSFETEGGRCIADDSEVANAEHSWRCPARHGGPGRQVTKEEIRAEILHFVGPALFAVLDGFGEDVTRIESVTLPIARGE